MKYTWLVLGLGILLGLVSLDISLAVLVTGLIVGTGTVLLCLRWPAVALTLFLVITPLGDGVGLPESVRLVPAMVGIVLVIGAFLWKLLRYARRTSHLPFEKLPTADVLRVTSAFGIWSMLSAGMSVRAVASFGYVGGMWIVVIVFLILAPHLIEDMKDIQLVLWSLAGSTALHALFAILYTSPVWPDFAVGLYPHPNYLGGLVMFGLPASLILWRVSENWQRVFLGFFMTITGLALFLSVSRAAIGAAVITIGIYVIASSNLRRVVGLCLVGLLFVVVSTPYVTSSEAYQLLERKMDRGLQGREVIWSFYLDLAMQHPVWGIGGGRTADLMKSSHFPVELSPHNTYLRTLLEFGVPGLLFYVVYLGYGIRSLWRYQPSERFGHDVRAVVIGVMCGSIFLQFFEATVLGSLKYSAVYPLFYLTLALVVFQMEPEVKGISKVTKPRCASPTNASVIRRLKPRPVL